MWRQIGIVILALLVFGFMCLALTGINGLMILFFERKILIAILLIMLSAVLIPHLLWEAGVLNTKWGTATAAIVLGISCFGLMFILLTHALASSILDNLEYIYNGYQILEEVEPEQTAVVKLLVRANSIPPFLDRLCQPDSTSICELSQEIQSKYYGDSGTTSASTYWWLVGVSLLTAVAGMGLTLYYGWNSLNWIHDK